jgi:DNA-binding transcriptional ArsR family regulator
MDVLTQLLSFRARAGLFHLLFGLSHSELHVRELARRSALHEATVRQELRRLKGLDLVYERRDGNRAYYRAKYDHPLYSEIHRIVLKTSGLADLLAQALKEGEIRVAFVFGSVANGTENAESDIDLVVIGKIGLRKLTTLLSGVSDQVGREINFHVLTEEEYGKRLKSQDHFVTHVLKGPKIYIVGTEDDFAAMGRKSLAQGGAHK